MAHLIEVTSVVPASLQRLGEFAGNLRPHGTMWTQLGLNVLLKRIVGNPSRHVSEASNLLQDPSEIGRRCSAHGSIRSHEGGRRGTIAAFPRCPRSALNPCHCITTVLPTKHLFGHAGP